MHLIHFGKRDQGGVHRTLAHYPFITLGRVLDPRQRRMERFSAAPTANYHRQYQFLQLNINQTFNRMPRGIQSQLRDDDYHINSKPRRRTFNYPMLCKRHPSQIHVLIFLFLHFLYFIYTFVQTNKKQGRKIETRIVKTSAHSIPLFLLNTKYFKRKISSIVFMKNG